MPDPPHGSISEQAQPVNPPPDSISERAQSVNWLVGFSGAALGGALLKFDWLLKLGDWAKGFFLAAAVLFLFTILQGVYYIFQLLAVKSKKQELATLELQALPGDEAKLDKPRGELTKAQDKAKKFHFRTMIGFGLAGVATVAALATGLLLPGAPPAKKELPPRNKFAITTSQVIAKGRVSHSHTFLLNQETGEIWEMVCDKGSLVAFRRVPKLSYDGKVEEPAPASTAKRP